MNKRLPADLFRRVLDESLDAAVIICEQGKIRYLNEAMHALTGYAGGDVMDQLLDGLVPGHVREIELRHRNGEIVPVELKAVDLGVDGGVRHFGAFLVDLRARRAERARTAALLAQLEQEAMTDPLTALPNRRAYDAELKRMAARSRRRGAPTTVGVADIDLFKQVNDQYGHPVGDLVLCEVAKAIERTARGTDFVARNGGEEFGMLFPDTSIEMALRVTERIRTAVAAAGVTTPAGECIRVTVSIGLAALAPDGAPDQAVADADAALYKAKQRGRNQVASH
jgi:diguanylate cyclase (GGDEF)-like protein